MSDEIKNKIDDALFNFYLNADEATINELLKNDIENFEQYEKKKKQLVFLSYASSNKKKNENLWKLVETFKEGLAQKTEKPIALLKQLVQSNPSFALYSNLDKLSKEDIANIIKDKNLIELIEQLSNDEKNH